MTFMWICWRWISNCERICQLRLRAAARCRIPVLNLKIVDAFDVQLDRPKRERKCDVAASIRSNVGVGPARWMELEIAGTPLSRPCRNYVAEDLIFRWLDNPHANSHWEVLALLQGVEQSEVDRRVLKVGRNCLWSAQLVVPARHAAGGFQLITHSRSRVSPALEGRVALLDEGPHGLLGISSGEVDALAERLGLQRLEQ